MLKRRRVLAHLSQRELERLTRIDQTVISRLENGRQYGLRWSRFAHPRRALDGLDDATAAPPPPWWVTHGHHPDRHSMLEQLRQEGLLAARIRTAAEVRPTRWDDDLEPE